MACPRLSHFQLSAPAAERRVRDGGHNWRIMYRVDPDAVLIVEVYPKKTRKIPQEIIDRCKKRLKDYDEAVKKAAKEPPEN